ncbi:hypothetical protein B0T19DRAFT_413779 [Cercophora scortea]|uniref:Uncharacterized protein n=1 Tax=Cercophora scortea TaxID=314031 RepID=A0AAE0MHA2_9PEZI|nr:hypothetical protein B0T19DRAFT_413779 [Cercophora scortea]
MTVLLGAEPCQMFCICLLTPLHCNCNCTFTTKDGSIAQCFSRETFCLDGSFESWVVHSTRIDWTPTTPPPASALVSVNVSVKMFNVRVPTPFVCFNHCCCCCSLSSNQCTAAKVCNNSLRSKVDRQLKKRRL